MSASAKITIGIETIEIGADPFEVLKKVTITAVPDRKLYNQVKQVVVDTDEALVVGDISTVEAILVHCITNDVDIDSAFSSTFKASITVNEGEWAIFKPAGILYMKNNDAGEQSTIEYWLIGTDA